MNAELKQALLQSSLCKYLDLADLDMLITYSKLIKFAPGEEILAQGKTSNGTYIIIEGEALVSAKVLGVGVINITVLDNGSFIGEISQLLKTASTVSVVAKTQMECLFITSAYFDMLTSFFPATKFKITKAVIEDVCFRQKNLHKKITAFLAQAHMVSKSIFGEVIQSLTWPREISLKEIDINHSRLKQMRFFNNFSDEQLDVLLAHCDVLDAARHCTIIREGEKAPICYLVLRGAVQSSVRQINKIAKLSVLAPVKIFCCMSFIDGTPSIFDFTTCERSVLLRFTAENMEELKTQNTDIWYLLYDEICKSFAALEQAASKLDIRLNSELYNR
jgi:CRP/FNR family transcriptional regulator, cyclic AMP receptor protein